MKEAFKKCWGFIIAWLILVITAVSLAVGNTKLRKEVKVLKQERKMYGELSVTCLKTLERYLCMSKLSCDAMIGVGSAIYSYAPSYSLFESLVNLEGLKKMATNDSMIFGKLREWLEGKGFRQNRILVESLGKKVSGLEFKLFESLD
jgi:hypothetical protein